MLIKSYGYLAQRRVWDAIICEDFMCLMLAADFGVPERNRLSGFPGDDEPIAILPNGKELFYWDGYLRGAFKNSANMAKFPQNNTNWGSTLTGNITETSGFRRNCSFFCKQFQERHQYFKRSILMRKLFKWSALFFCNNGQDAIHSDGGLVHDMRKKKFMTWFDELTFFHLFILWAMVIVFFGVSFPFWRRAFLPV